MLRDTFFTKIDAVAEIADETLAETEALEFPIDLFRSDTNLILRAPIVGVDINQIEVTLSNNRLTVRKTSTPEPLDPPTRTYVEECHWGELARTIDLPVAVNPDRTRATLTNGVLTVIMPILSPHTAKLIKIKDKL